MSEIPSNVKDTVYEIQKILEKHDTSIYAKGGAYGASSLIVKSDDDENSEYDVLDVLAKTLEERGEYGY